MCNERLDEILTQLKRPFHPSQVSWKPGMIKGDRALALAYADLRVYMNRLDEVCGSDWSVAYEPWGEDRIICRLTICGVTRSSTGEMSAQDEKNEMGGTVAESQSFKRAAVMFGLSRYLYNLPNGWADFDPATKRFTDKAKAKLTGILVQHYRRSTENPKSELADLFAENATGASEAESPAENANASHSPTTPASEDNGTPPHNRLFGIGLSVFGPAWQNGGRMWFLKFWSRHATPDNERGSLSDFSDDEKTLIADYLEANRAKLQKAWQKYEAEKA